MLDLSEEEDLCPIALGSYLFGDKWIPVIIRDIALFDRRTFNDLLKNNNEKISSGALSSRLQRMCQLGMLEVSDDASHAQKKLYSLTEAGIAFVPIIFKMAAWTAQFRNPSKQVVAMTRPYIDNDQIAINSVLENLEKIHISKTVKPEPFWWASKVKI